MSQESPPPLLGIHHLTAVSARIRLNYRFYTQVMGMRLVKRSVNQDDVGAYHLFYADAVGTPGCDLTFFDWSVPAEERGTRSIVQTSLRVRTAESLEWWSERLKESGDGATVGGLTDEGGRSTLHFTDPEGQRLALVADGGAGTEPVPWSGSPVPPEHQLRGLGPIRLSVPNLEPTRTVLVDLMGMTSGAEYRSARSDRGPDGDQVGVHIFSMAGGGPHAELHVAVEPELQPVRPGAGGVHHVAFRTPDEASYDAWAERLRSHRIPNSGKVDRYYFRSLYFREPSGILFEIATDGPGFDVDEPVEELGENLALPPFLESRRDEITRNLKPLE